jgi:hypothetical protein
MFNLAVLTLLPPLPQSTVGARLHHRGPVVVCLVCAAVLLGLRIWRADVCGPCAAGVSGGLLDTGRLGQQWHWASAVLLTRRQRGATGQQTAAGRRLPTCASATSSRR